MGSRQMKWRVLSLGILTGCAWVIVISLVLDPFEVPMRRSSIFISQTVRIEHEIASVRPVASELEEVADVQQVEDMQEETVASPQVEEMGSLENDTESLQRIRVGLYRGYGSSSRSWSKFLGILECYNETIEVVPLTEMGMEEINPEKLDVMVIAGGSAKHMLNRHSQNGTSLTETVKSFLRQGGGYVGFCAGAYLGRSFFRVSPFHKASLMLGVGQITNVQLEQPMDRAPFPISDTSINEKNLYYANGPIFRDLKNDALPPGVSNPKVLLRLHKKKGRVEIKVASKTQPKLYTTKDYVGMPVIVANDYSKGRVVLSTGHPEADISGGLKREEIVQTKCHSAHANMIVNMVYYAANRTNFDFD